MLGGSKVSDKLGVIGHLLPRVNTLLIGGGMLFTFLAAQGYAPGEVDLGRLEVTDQYAREYQQQNVAVPSLGTVPVMDAEPAHLGTGTWDYVAGGSQPSAYTSQVALYASTLYQSIVPSATVDPSYVAATPTPVEAISADAQAGAIQVYWRAPDNFSAGIGWGLQTVKSYVATARYVDPAGKVTAKTCTVTGVGASVRNV